MTQTSPTLLAHVADLLPGDVVHAEGGMRVLVINRVQPTSRPGGWYTRGVVINRADVDPCAVPMAYTPADADGRHRWTLQGNHLAQPYRVERELRAQVRNAVRAAVADGVTDVDHLSDLPAVWAASELGMHAETLRAWVAEDARA
jgi:hypothetical protein